MQVEAERVGKAYSKLNEFLSEKEKDVIMRFYGLDGRVRHSLAEIAEIYQVTRERIRQIKSDALKKLKITNLKNLK